MSDIDLRFQELEERLNDISGHVDQLNERMEFVGTNFVEPVQLLTPRVEKLEEKVGHLSDFIKIQVDINNVLKFLVSQKYTKTELETALDEYEKARNVLKKEEN